MNIVTLGGVTVGVAILILVGLHWWFAGKRRASLLVPFLLAFAYGMLAILSAGGLLGAAAGVALWGSNGLGDLALVYGVGGGAPNVTREQPTALTDGGHAIVLLLTVTLVGLWKFARKVPNLHIAAGSAAGVSLGLSGTLAGIAAVPLASAVNILGTSMDGLL